MAISLQETLPNGVPLSYHRIVSLTTVVNQQCIIEVASYVSQEAREQEQAAIADPETGCDVYVSTQLISVDYDPEMSVTKAYALLKGMDEYKDATDVIDNWAVGVAYYVDDLRMHDGKRYRCLQSHTSQADWAPDLAPALWVEERDPDTLSEWVQPDSTNPYMKGDRCLFHGIVKESTIDDNIWSPADYPAGWRDVVD
jgi:hypothetical protein